MDKKVLIAVGSLVAAVGLAILSQQLSPSSYLDVRICPDRKIGKSDEENLLVMRKNLEAIAQHFPQQKLNGFVFFEERITVEQFVDLFKKYDFEIGSRKGLFEGYSIQLLIEERAADKIQRSIAAEKLSPAHLDTESFAQGLRAYPPPNDGVIVPTGTRVNSFLADATAENFLKLWNENEHLVRGIGVGCTKPGYILSPTDPIVF